MKKLLYAMCLVTLSFSFANGEQVDNDKTSKVMLQLLTNYSKGQAFTQQWSSLDAEHKNLVIKENILDELLQSNSFNKKALAEILEFCLTQDSEIFSIKEQEDTESKIKLCILPTHYEQIIKDNDLCLLFWKLIQKTKKSNVLFFLESNNHNKSYRTLLSALATMQTPHENGCKIVLDCIESNDKMINFKDDYLIISVAKALCHATGKRRVWLEKCFNLLQKMSNFNDIQNQESFKKAINDTNDYDFKIFCDEFFDTGKHKFVREKSEPSLSTSSNHETEKQSTTSENNTNNDRNFVILPSEPVSNTDSTKKPANKNRSSNKHKRAETPNNSYNNSYTKI